MLSYQLLALFWLSPRANKALRAVTLERMSSRLGHHSKERVRNTLKRYKKHHLNLPWRLPTAAQTRLFMGAAPEGYLFEATRFSRVCGTMPSKSAAGTSTIVSSVIDLP